MGTGCLEDCYAFPNVIADAAAGMVDNNEGQGNQPYQNEDGYGEAQEGAGALAQFDQHLRVNLFGKEGQVYVIKEGG